MTEIISGAGLVVDLLWTGKYNPFIETNDEVPLE